MEKKQKKPPKKSKLEQERIGWARDRKEDFARAVKQVCEDRCLAVTKEQLDEACLVAIEDHAFGFPVEYKLADMFAKKEDYEEVFADMQEVMRSFRAEYYRMRSKRMPSA